MVQLLQTASDLVDKMIHFIEDFQMIALLKLGTALKQGRISFRHYYTCNKGIKVSGKVAA